MGFAAHSSATGVLGALLAILAGCTGGAASDRTIPDALLPQARYDRHSDRVKGDVIRYRLISRDDFLAESPNPSVAEHAALIGAHVCAAITAGDDPLILHEPGPDNGFTARPYEVTYYAEMDRSCSWWNDDNTALPAEYVLQHEQIHFAITERFAREIDARIDDISGHGESKQAATAAFEAKVEALLRSVGARYFERQTEFDEATAGEHRPEVQERWYQEVEAALNRSE